MPESCIVILDPSEYMRNGDYMPTRNEAQQDAARWLIADITTSSPENTVGVMAGTSVLVSTTNNIGQLFEAVKSTRRRFAPDFEIENSLQVAFMALKHRRNKMGSQRIILFVGSPIMDSKAFPKLAKSMRKNNVTLQIVTLGDEPNQDKLELLVQNNSEESRMINIPKGTVPSEFLSATATFGTANGGYGMDMPGGMGGDTFDPSMDPELAMALQISLEEERTRQAQLQQQEEDNQQQQQQGQGQAEESSQVDPSAATPSQPQAQAFDDEMAMMQQALVMSLQEAEGGGPSDQANEREVIHVEQDDSPEPKETIDPKSSDDDSKIEPELVTIQARAASMQSDGSSSTSSSSRPGSSPENAISLVDVDDSLPDSYDARPQPSAVARSAAAAAMGSTKPPPPVMIINVEDEKYAENDFWEDEPKRETSFADEVDNPNSNDVWENEPATGGGPRNDEEPRVSVVASSFDDYGAEAKLLASPPKSQNITLKNHDEETRSALMMPDTTLPLRDDKDLPPPPSMPPPEVPPTTNSQESNNWNQLNQALDVYYTVSSETNKSPPQHADQQHATLFRSSSIQSSGPAVRSCWSNLDQAFDEYNTAINEISNFLPAPGMMMMASSMPPNNYASMHPDHGQGEEERQDNVPREEYQKLASELDEAKKAMAIMQGIVQEKDEMIVALREIMGMMQQERRKQTEGDSDNAKSASESEREMTDSLIQEIRKKNRNLESLRTSLQKYKQPNASGEAGAAAAAPVSQSLTEKRRKKRELEKLRASQKRPTTQN